MTVGVKTSGIVMMSFVEITYVLVKKVLSHFPCLNLQRIPIFGRPKRKLVCFISLTPAKLTCVAWKLIAEESSGIHCPR